MIYANLFIRDNPNIVLSRPQRSLFHFHFLFLLFLFRFGFMVQLPPVDIGGMSRAVLHFRAT